MGIFEKFKLGFKKSANKISEGFREIIIKKEIDDKKLDEIDKDKKIVLIKTIIFALGFSFVFISLGMAASFLGNVLIFFGKELRIAAGIIIILFSLKRIMIQRIINHGDWSRINL